MKAHRKVSPETHLLASWIIAAKTTDNARDCRLVTLAGILPDADGLGVIVDIASEWFGGIWKGQWRLDGWFNRWLTVGLFFWALWLPVRLGYSVVGVFNQRADGAFVGVLRKWHETWVCRRQPVR